MSEPGLYERLGGELGISVVVSQLYRRALDDPELAPYFHDTDMSAQRDRLAAMIGEAVGGPPAPWLQGLEDAHRGRGITDAHFTRMAAHLVAVLHAHEVSVEDLAALGSWLEAGRRAVVDASETAG